MALNAAEHYWIKVFIFYSVYLGTLTTNRMTVVESYIGGKSKFIAVDHLSRHHLKDDVATSSTIREGSRNFKGLITRRFPIGAICQAICDLSCARVSLSTAVMPLKFW